MKQKLILFLIFFSSVSHSQTDLFIAYTTLKSDEPLLINAFIAGYESFGRIWNGRIKEAIWVTPQSVYDVEYFMNVDSTITNQTVGQYCRENGYSIITHNGSVNPLSFGDPLFDIGYSQFYADSIQFIDCGGSNKYRDHINDEPLENYISVGAGYSENATGYNVEFWCRDPYASQSNINWIMKGDTSYTISSITRLTDSTMRISIEGLTDVVGYGFEIGVPIRITGLTGTDISPLPNGTLLFLTNANNNSPGRLLFDFNTTSGTLNTNQTPTAGTFKTGTANGNILIRTNTPVVDMLDAGITITGVEGYSNNPNKTTGVANDISGDLLQNKLEITHSIGTGRYIGGGKLRWDTQSYSHAYFGGLIAAIKDSLKCSWWEARYRLRQTSSGAGIFDIYSGYGSPNIAAVFLYDAFIPDDPYNTLGSIGNLQISRTENLVNMQFEYVNNALFYNIYRNGVLKKTFDASNFQNTFQDTVVRVFSGNPYEYYYEAVRSIQSVNSQLYPIGYYGYPSIRIK